MEAGERDSCRSTSAAMLEFSSGNLTPEWVLLLCWLLVLPPPFPPLWLLAFRECRVGGATHDVGGEDEGVPGDPENHKLIKVKIHLQVFAKVM